MRPRPQFALLFTALLALSALPAWKLWAKFDIRIQAYEQQKQVDLKRPLLEQLQETLREAHRAVAAAMPASATTVGGKFLAVDSETLAALQRTEALAPVFLSGFDAAGRIHLIAHVPSFAGHQDYLRAGSMPSGTAEAIHLSRFVPPQEPQEPLSRAIGNAVRGLEGYSLAPYEIKAMDGSPSTEDSPRRYGAWLWDREHQFGMVIEVPAEAIEARVAPEEARFQRGRRFLYFLCVASYLLVLAALARVIQGAGHRRKNHTRVRAKG